MSHILLVDDDEIFSDFIVNALMDENHIVGHCRNGMEALEALEFRVPKLLILDCNMPEMTGIELLHIIRRDSRLFNIPVLMLTARSSESDERIGRYAGATDYLAKPVVIEELLYMVDELLANPTSVDPQAVGLVATSANKPAIKAKSV